MFQLLKIWIVVISITGSGAADSDQLCQLTLDCQRPLTSELIQCIAPFSKRFMEPLILPDSPVNEGYHLLDLFIDSGDDDAGCRSLGVVADAAKNGTVSVNLVVGCRSIVTFAMFLLNYVTGNQSARMPCGRGRSGWLAATFWNCRFYRDEKLRLTVLSRDTLLIEDLSALVPPGTRIFFRTRNLKNNTAKRVINRCYCKSYNQLVTQYLEICQRWRKVTVPTESSGELIIAIVLIGMQWISLIFGKIWIARVASQKDPDLKRA